jgi:hypothetical protein
VRAPEALRAAAEISARDPQLVISLPGANGGDASKLVGTIQPTRDLEAAAGVVHIAPSASARRSNPLADEASDRCADKPPRLASDRDRRG